MLNIDCDYISDVKKTKGANRSRILFVILLFVLSYSVVFIFHSRAVSRDMRHTIVAEGNISHHGARFFWQRGIYAWFIVVKSDADDAGRVRPMHWIHHHVPFVLTLLRNGDLTHSDPDVKRSDRVNGCLQTHTYYQLFCVSVMLTALAWIIISVSGVWWSGVLFVILAAGGGMCLRQNIILNHSDSGEIGQMMYISLYLVSALPVLMGKVMRPGRELLAVLFLLLAYAMKETSVILLPAVSLTLLTIAVLQLKRDDGYRKFIIRHLLVHAVFVTILLFFVWISRAGEYVSERYEVKTDYAMSISRAWSMLDLPPDITCMMIVGLVAFFVIIYLSYRQKGRIDDVNIPAVGSVLLFGALAAGFWVVNLPWQEISGKYFINSYLFVCGLVSVLVVAPASFLKNRALMPAYWLWVAGTVFFIGRHLPEQRDHTRSYYRNHYGYRSSAPAIVQDLAQTVKDSDADYVKVRVVTGQMFPEGALSFWRRLNRDCGLNIAQGGEPVAMLGAAERNYFRRYQDAKSVDLTSGVDLGVLDGYDRIYFLIHPSEVEKEALDAAGFRFVREFHSGRLPMLVACYEKAGEL